MLGGDGAGVVDLAADQRGIAAPAHLDRCPGSTTARRPALAREAAAAGDEVLVGGGQRRGDEGAGAHRARRGDRDAVRVDEIDLPVGVELPGDGGGRRAGDAVQHRRGCRGLADVDARALRRSRSLAS